MRENKLKNDEINRFWLRINASTKEEGMKPKNGKEKKLKKKKKIITQRWMHIIAQNTYLKENSQTHSSAKCDIRWPPSSSLPSSL